MAGEQHLNAFVPRMNGHGTWRGERLGPVPLPNELLVAAADEASPQSPNRLPPIGTYSAAHRLLRASRYRLTTRAARIAALRPQGAAPEALAELIAGRVLMLLERRIAPRPMPGAVRASQSVAPPAPPTARETKPAWIEYQFLDVAGHPVSGLDYSLQLTTGTVEKGTLPPDGRLHREPIPEGRCVARIGMIEDARWGAKTAGTHEPVELRVRTEGFDPGTPVRFEIFRLYKERPQDALATLSAVLDAGGQAKAQWCCGSRPNEAGAQVIFKAAVGTHWKKSSVLKLERGIVSAAWSAEQVDDGAAVRLAVELRGVADGAQATFQVYEKDWLTKDDLADDAPPAPAVVQGGRIEVPWVARWRPDDEKTGCYGFIHYYCVIEVDGLTGYSGLLAVKPPPGAAVCETHEAPTAVGVEG